MQLCCIWFQVDSTVWVGYSSGIIRVFDILRVDAKAQQRVPATHARLPCATVGALREIIITLPLVGCRMISVVCDKSRRIR